MEKNKNKKPRTLLCLHVNKGKIYANAITVVINIQTKHFCLYISFPEVRLLIIHRPKYYTILIHDPNINISREQSKETNIKNVCNLEKKFSSSNYTK